MATTTPNFGWSVPTSTDLVKDGATAIETLGDAIDASLVDLKGGTTGQVLAKNSNTDMDFVWSADASGIPASAFTAKGVVLVGTGTSTYAAQTVGANGTVLTADSAEADGVKWATPAAGGKILQVVSSTITTNATITSTSLTDTNITLSITPTLATSKILVMITANSQNKRSSSVNSNGSNARLLRGATTLYDFPNDGWSNIYLSALGTGDVWTGAPRTIVYLDSPATTSATTYKLQACVPNTTGSHTVIFQPTSMGASQIILMEVGA